MSLIFIKVVGIFERQDILFDFRVTPFFIVGPNGTGKSTALKILHNILTAQWSSLSELPFVGIEFRLNGMVFGLDRAELVNIDRTRSILGRYARRQIVRRGPLILPTSWASAQEVLSKDPPGLSGIGRKATPSFLAQIEVNYEGAAALSNFVERESKGRVLWFPTYRRIERDLHELLEENNPDEIEFDEQVQLAPKIAERFKASGEVIGFGGQDIRALLNGIASKIDVEARRTLSEHSVRFLEALSKDKTNLTKQARNLVLSEAGTDKLLERISVSSSSSLDVESIKSSIDALRAKISKAKPGRLTQQQEMLLFYVGELLKANETIQSLAAPLLEFSGLISKYLAPVKTSYLRESDNHIVILDKSGNEIELEQLSSGEKQILAFFAFLTLEGNAKPKYILIDEPELSLSVSWQKTLIKDISDTSRAQFVVSATHSPFIFQNFPINHVMSLGAL